MSEGFPRRDDTDPCLTPIVVPFLINANLVYGGITYPEAFHKHFELILELNILFRLRGLNSRLCERETKDKLTRSSCSFSPFCFCLASLDSGSSFLFGFGSSEGTGIDNVGSGIVIGNEDGEAGWTLGKVTFPCGRASLIHTRQLGDSRSRFRQRATKRQTAF